MILTRECKKLVATDYRKAICSNFNSLPSGVIAKIFKYLSKSQRQEVRKVCIKWRRLIEAAFGIHLEIKNSNWYKRDLYTVSSATFRNFTAEIKYSQPFSLFLRKLELRGVNNIDKIILPLLKASKDTLTYISLKEIDLLEVKPSKCFSSENFNPISLPLLNTLVISPLNRTTFPQKDNLTTFFEKGVTYKNLKNLEIDRISASQICTVISFPKLYYQEQLNKPYTPRTPRGNFLLPKQTPIHSILKILENNCKTIEKFSVGSKDTKMSFKFEKMHKVMANLMIARLRDRRIVEFKDDFQQFNEEWTKVFSGQIKMESLQLKLMNIALWNILHKTVLRRCPNLTVIHLRIETDFKQYGKKISFSNFSTCLKLKYLNFSAPGIVKVDARDLPAQELEQLIIDGVLCIEELEEISKRCKNLTLFSISRNHLKFPKLPPPPRISLELFKTLAKLPKIRNLIIESTNIVEWTSILEWTKRVGISGSRNEKNGFEIHPNFHKICNKLNM